MKRGTAAKVILGKDTLMDVPSGIVHGTDVILGGKAGLLNDFGGLVLSNNLMIGKKVSRGTITTITVRGQSPLVLPDGISGSLQAVKAFGGTEQNGTPTPDAPVDIVCNNGVLKFVDDELPVGYRRVLGYACDNDVLWQITDFHLRGSDTIRISFSVTAACNVFGCYQGTDATDNYDLYVSATSGSRYLRYGDGTYLSYWSSDNMGQRFDVVFTPTGSSGMPQDSTWSPMTFESANDMLLAATTLTGTSSKLRGNLYGSFVVDGRLKLIPCERVSDGVLGYYDTYTGTFYEPQGTATSLGYDYSHYAVVADGPIETIEIKDDQNATVSTATCEILLSVGEYTDEQEVISGAITRKVGIKAFDGTENWTLASNTDASGNRVFYVPMPDRDTGNNKPMLCSHFAYFGSASYTTLTAGKFLTTAATTNTSLYFDGGSITTKANWQQWLADQYAAGTPVIVIYPLATPTTESVTGQTLQVQAGDNTLEITQASLDGLELEATYKSLVQLTIQEVEDANLNNNVEVTIS